MKSLQPGEKSVGLREKGGEHCPICGPGAEHHVRWNKFQIC